MTYRREPKPRPIRVRAVVFGLDGTLIHSTVKFTKLKQETIGFLVHKGLSAEKFSTSIKTYEMMRIISTILREKEFTKQDITLVYRKI